MPPTITELQEFIAGSDMFKQLDIKDKLSTVQEALGLIYGEPYAALPIEDQTKAAGQLYTKFYPKTTTETILGYLPTAPLTDAYIYNRQVSPSPLASRLGVPESFGPIELAIENTALTVGTGLLAAYLLPVELPFAAGGIAAYAARSIIGQRVRQEALAGGLYEIGKFVTTPPASLGEAALQLGVGVVGGGLVGGAIEPIRRLIGKGITSRRLLNVFGEQTVVDDVLNKFDSPTGILSREEQEGLLNAISKPDGRLRDSLEAQEIYSRLTNKINQQEQALVRDRTAYQTLRTEEAAAANAVGETGDLAALRATEEAGIRYQREFGQGVSRLRRQAEETELALGQDIVGRYETALSEAGLGDTLAEFTERQAIAEFQKTEAIGNRVARRIQADLETSVIQRNADINASIADIEAGRAVTSRTEQTKSEALLIRALNNPDDINGGFIGREPVTLPLGAIQDTPTGPRPVIVERVEKGQATIRGFGNTPLSSLREAVNPTEIAQLDTFLQRNNVLPTPDAAESISILGSRVVAEQDKLLADAHALRPDFSKNTSAQTQEFGLRRQAVEGLLQATNREFSEATTTAVRDVKPLAGGRIVASLDGIPLKEANDTALAVRGAGFENVRLVGRPDGMVDISFSRGASAAEETAVDLNAKRASHAGVYDTVSGTYEGLTPNEHIVLGRAFGLPDKQIEKFLEFTQETLKDLSSRGIRTPVVEEILGIRPIIEQISARQAAKPDLIRPEVIPSLEQLRGFEIGDVLNVPVSSTQTKPFQVSAIVPDGSGERIVTMQSLDKANFGEPSNPIPESELRTKGALRNVTKPIAPGASQLPLAQPARTLEALLNPSLRLPPKAAVQSSVSSIQTAAREAGFAAVANRRGEIDVTVDGIRTKFVGDHALVDAARFVESMRNIREQKRGLADGFGGPDCIGG